MFDCLRLPGTYVDELTQIMIYQHRFDTENIHDSYILDIYIKCGILFSFLQSANFIIIFNHDGSNVICLFNLPRRALMPRILYLCFKI